MMVSRSALLLPLLAAAAAASTVIWNTPSRDSSGSMPLGNGDIGINLWAEPSGELVFYVSKTDSWNENARLLKLVRVRVRAWPLPWQPGGAFSQEFDETNAEIRVRLGDRFTWRVWVDANRPVVRVEALSPEPLAVTPHLEVWRKTPRILSGQEAHSAYGLDGGPTPIVEDADAVLPETFGRLLWLHRNQRSIWRSTLEHQGLASLIPQLRDPLLHRTFGGAVTWGRQLVSVYALTAQTPTVDEWLARLDSLIDAADAKPLPEAYAEHRAWWRRFWDRSWVRLRGHAPEAETINRGYALQRFLNAAAGRGAFPIKFNGSIFTVDARETNASQPARSELFDADYRRWGGPYWFQNTRLPYWAMLAAGDYDLVPPLYRMYLDALPLAKARTRLYFSHGGAFFPETMYFWGAYANSNYGWDRRGRHPSWVENAYIRHYYTSGLELIALLHDYRLHTGDQAFHRETLLPLAREILEFYDAHYPLGGDGRLRIDPGQALETYQKAVNPLPDVAGLRWVLDRLNLPEFASLRKEIPDLPMDDDRLAPAEEILEPPKNSENPELYAIFPFRLYGVGKPDLETARRTFAARRVKDDTGGWRQDAIQAAYLGLADEAASRVARNFSKSHPGSRFPAFWGPNFDWIPDQDHGNATMIALQRMLLQADNGDIHLFPAWPRHWDVDFKLHAPGGVSIRAVYEKGRVTSLEISPPTARRRVVLPAGLRLANGTRP